MSHPASSFSPFRGSRQEAERFPLQISWFASFSQTVTAISLVLLRNWNKDNKTLASGSSQALSIGLCRYQTFPMKRKKIKKKKNLLLSLFFFFFDFLFGRLFIPPPWFLSVCVCLCVCFVALNLELLTPPLSWPSPGTYSMRTVSLGSRAGSCHVCSAAAHKRRRR